jgi:hypothetical protein
MTITPDYVDLHHMVDRLDPDEVRVLRAVAERFLLAKSTVPVWRDDSAEEWTFSMDAPPVRQLSAVGIMHAGPTLAADSAAILRHESGDPAE